MISRFFGRLGTLAIIAFLFLYPISVFANLDITVKSDAGWGQARTSNIKRLCENVALHFQEQLRDEYKVEGDIDVVYRDEGPAVSFWEDRPEYYEIGLFTTGTRNWAGIAHQFGHEFCHIMHNFDESYKELPNDVNWWFQEGICELANLWVIRRMSETWKDRPPYQNWTDYRFVLGDYASILTSRIEVQYEGSAEDWLDEWEDRMRDSQSFAFSYERVSQLTYKFLDIFEKNPEAWNAVRQMPFSNSRMSAYMQEWYDVVDTEDKKFVKAIAAEMGVSVDTIASIDADINDDGYVDLSDVMIVRSGMTQKSTYNTDVNADGVTNILDLLLVKAKAFEAIAAAAPEKRKVNITTWGSIKEGFRQTHGL